MSPDRHRPGHDDRRVPPAARPPEPHPRRRRAAADPRHVRAGGHPPERAARGVYSADSRGLDVGPLETASLTVTDRTRDRVVPAPHARDGGRDARGPPAPDRPDPARARPCARPPTTATPRASCGIDDRHLYAVAIAIALGTVAIGGVFLGIRTTFAPADGPVRLIFAFEAVVIGGLGSLWGTLVGGVILGVSQALGNQVSPSYQILAGHLVFLAILVVPTRRASSHGPGRGSDGDDRDPRVPDRADHAEHPVGLLAARRRGRRAGHPAGLGRRRPDATPGRGLHAARDGADVEPPRRLRGSRLDRPAGVHRHRGVRPVRRRRQPRVPAGPRGPVRDRGRRAGGARHVASSRSACRAATSPSGRGSSPRSSGSWSPTPRSSGRAPASRSARCRRSPRPIDRH